MAEPREQNSDIPPPGLEGLRSPHILLEPYNYLASVPGKDIRGTLIEGFNAWIRVQPSSCLSTIKQIIAKLHNASLMIDDIEDSSRKRRGVPVVHSIYGVPATINSANFVYFQACYECYSLVDQLPPALDRESASPCNSSSSNNNNAAAPTTPGSRRLMEGFLYEMLRLHQGQGEDIWWRDNAKVPTEKEYKDMVIDKTGGIFRLAVRMMCCFSTLPQPEQALLLELASLLGLYFQIIDDFLNLQSSVYEENKEFCEDISEGKFSFPIIHSLACTLPKGDSRLLNIIKQRTSKRELKEYALKIMKETGSFEYTTQVLSSLGEQVERLIEKLPQNEMIQRIVDQWKRMWTSVDKK